MNFTYEDGDKMELDLNILNEISKKCHDSFYILDINQLKYNFNELLETFRQIYPESYIAYSYKTNYIPRVCSVINDLGGYAEIVSDMEYEIAKRIGVDPCKIIFNGPYKNKAAVKELMLSGGIVNIDSTAEIENIEELVQQYPDKNFNLGIRCNFDIGDGVVSRFGFDVMSNEFVNIIHKIGAYKNVNLFSIQCHFADRSIDTWSTRTEKMLDLIENIISFVPDIIDFGGGLYGKMPDSLKSQFKSNIPSYQDYANIVAKKFADKFFDCDKKPKLFIEPGSALVGDVMKFVCKVESIKNIRGKDIATVLGSIYNINPTLNKKNPPLSVYASTAASERKYYCDLDFGGFTCIESDYLYRGYNGELAVGDYVVFGNVGSYSIVLKPPFILPNFPVIDFDEVTRKTDFIKNAEIFDDLFQTYKFDF